MQIINVNDDRYVVCGTVSAQKVTHLTTDELKNWYSLADTVLQNGDTFYICMKIIDVERRKEEKVVAALRSETLRAIAKESGGKYFDEDDQGKLIFEIDSNLIKKEEELQNFYSSWRLAPLASFLLMGFLFFRSLV